MYLTLIACQSRSLLLLRDFVLGRKARSGQLEEKPRSIASGKRNHGPGTSPGLTS
jgi:hypothetical protein